MVKLSIRRLGRALLATSASAALAVGMLTATAATSQAATQGPCDIYAAGGTECVAAHSTTRALYGTYNGPLYQVRRASDNATKDIGLLNAGGVADAAAQDSFCAATSCVITVIYDQSGKGNHLTQALKGHWPGPAEGGNDNLANAFEAPVTVAGHKAYGVYVAPGTGYRNNHTNGIATGDQSEGMYAIFDGTHFNGGCCFDYGNAETTGNDDGNGTMEALYFGNSKGWGWGSGNGPWVMADLENGLFSGVNRGFNANDPSVNNRFLTAMLKGGQNQWAIHGGDAQAGGLSTFYNGIRPTAGGYNPMKKQGAIILGIGGDNSNTGGGTFYEGVMTSGYPSDATENAVQANITAAGYNSGSTGTGTLTPGSRISLQATTAPCCTSHYLRHDDADTKVVISSLKSASSATDKADATWIVRTGLADTSCVSFESANSPGQFLRHSNYQLYLNTDTGGSSFAKDATFCPTAGNSGAGMSFQSANFPTKYLRHYNYTAYIASNGGSNAWDSSNSWTADTSWLVTQPLG
ncbi:alpha-L-arabinofuranosidase B [Kitasatospora sp. NPDC085895]|uniref:alpha-L-arabinofuranosidase B n=1 Tax=Kitasatospora sp. NPDC085895 TaxID=3155057 RepID=UPI003450DAFE